jgi:hypothetical protein
MSYKVYSAMGWIINKYIYAMDWIIAFIKTQLRNYIGWGSVNRTRGIAILGALYKNTIFLILQGGTKQFWGALCMALTFPPWPRPPPELFPPGPGPPQNFSPLAQAPPRTFPASGGSAVFTLFVSHN